MTTSNDIEQQGLGDKAQTVTNRAQEKASETAEQVSQQARETARSLEQQAVSALDTRKSQAAQELGSVASAIWESSQALREQGQDMPAQYTEQVAAQIDHLSSYLQAHDMDDLVNEAEGFARRQPQLFLGGAFIVGLLTARFLKSSRRGEMNRYEQQWGGNMQGSMANYAGSTYGSYGSSVGYGGGDRSMGRTTDTYGTGTTRTGSRESATGDDWSSSSTGTAGASAEE